MIRYCDDFVVVCESKHDAEDFLKKLEERFAKFDLQMSQDKTKIVEFGRGPWKRACKKGSKLKTFDFLGFTHFCTKSRKGYFMMGHKTSKVGLNKALKDMNLWLKKVRNLVSLKLWWPLLKAKLTGHFNYYGISGNFRCLKQFYLKVISLVFKWINRRSQKKSMNFDMFLKYLNWHPIPAPKIMYSLYKPSPRVNV